MTFDPNDLLYTHPTNKTHNQTANGACVPVANAGAVNISPSLHLKNCLLIPSLSHKLLSVSQLTKDLNCTVLLTSTNCIVQDAQTGTIIGRGTERGGLYYVDEVIQNSGAMLAHGSPAHQLRTWHRRLGHPSLGYLKKLFPSLNSCNASLDCETCILAKSHKQSYVPSNTRAPKTFDIVHSDVWGPAPILTLMVFHILCYLLMIILECAGFIF